MRRRHPLIVGVVVVVTAATLTAQRRGGAGGPAVPGTITPVATVKELMHAIVIPASDIIFKLASEPPTDDTGWTSARNAALVVAESSNLLMLPGRAPDQNAWMEMSRAQMTAARAAIAAADEKSADALERASNDLYDTCANCHATYMKN